LRDFNKERENYEFFKYHTIIPYTLDNLSYFQYGVSNWNQEKDHRKDSNDFLTKEEKREFTQDPFPQYKK